MSIKQKARMLSASIRALPPYRPERECDPTYTLDDHITQARKEMGEKRWDELNREWGA